MFCTNCGKQVADGLKFCTSCGAPIEETAQGVSESSSGTAAPTEAIPATAATKAMEPVVSQEAPSNGKSKKPLLIGIVVVAVIAIALVLVFLVIKPFEGGSASDAANSSAGVSDQIAQEQEDAGSGTATVVEEIPGSASSSLMFVGITTANASSNLATGGVNTSDYSPKSAIDGSSTTCWAEGASGSGIGESITLAGSSTQLFSGFDIRNGYQKSDDVYQKNNRPKKLEVYVDGTLVDTVSLADSGLTTQKFTFAKPVEGKEITFKIADVYSGTKYNDCCISEITVF